MDKRKKHAAVFGLAGVLSACTMIGINARPCDAGAVEPTSYSVRGGTAWIEFDMWTLEELGLEFVASGPDGAHVVEARAGFPLDPSSTLTVVPAEEARGWDIKGRISTSGGLMLLGLEERAVVGNLVLARSEDGGWSVRDALDPQDRQRTVFELSSVLTDFSPVDENLRIVAEVAFAESWARELDFPQAAGAVVGVLTVDVDVSPGERGTTNAVKDARSRPARSADAAATGDTAGVIGPDIEIADLYSVLRSGRTGDITAYGVATNACNLGDERASWVRTTNQHPVIMQNMYRLKDGRLEQIGMSWMKHGFYAVNGNVCGPCLDRTAGQELGVGCSDPYSASLNAAQSNMSARSDLNAHTGYFPFPGYRPPYDPVIGRRLQVHEADLDFGLNPDALYFVQGHYVAADDAGAGNNNNNASYRRVTVTVTGLCSGGAIPGSSCKWSPDYGDRECWACVGGTYPDRACTTDATCSGGGSCNTDGVCSPTIPYAYNMAVTGMTQRGQCAIRAWQDHDASVAETDVQVPGEGLFILSAKATDLGNGQWHYEYALQNLNSDRSCGSFSVPLPSGAVVEDIGFHDVDYHSGDPFDGTDWPVTVSDDEITWSTTSYGVDPDANALRWGTVYNFRFSTQAVPSETEVSLGLFKPGDPAVVASPTVGPSVGLIDCNSNGISDACDISCDAPDCAPPCGASADCNTNGVPDVCEPDCNENGVADACDIRDGTSHDCQPDDVPDDCELTDNDCNGNEIPDDCEVLEDTDGDGFPDCADLCPCWPLAGGCECPSLGLCCWETWCIPNYPRDACLADGGTPDCDESLCEDGCLIEFEDCNDNGIPDGRDVTCVEGCDPACGESADCNLNEVPDECEPDSDGDGVIDGCDGCPEDPYKVEPGACGCGVPDDDADGDGTPDCIDGCPEDPYKIVPGVCGCGVSDDDTDGDGTEDCNDGCPDDPYKLEPGVCGCGVADDDTDGDGTEDCNDGCPGDPYKLEPGACGCGVADDDNDGDGTEDCNDGCPEDPSKLEPGLCGCGVPDDDTDGDGTEDCNDGCPEDPYKVAPGLCGCGVVDDHTDGDGDTFPDCVDQCPGQDDRIDEDGNGIPDCLEQEVIPTLSQWGVVILALLLLAGAKIRFHRRRAATV